MIKDDLAESPTLCSHFFREKAMISVLETKPVAGARCLVPAFYDKNYAMDTRLGILSWLTTAADSISEIYRSGEVTLLLVKLLYFW